MVPALRITPPVPEPIIVTPTATLKIPLPSPGLALAHTLDCGQAFCWREASPGVWLGWIAGVRVRCFIKDGSACPMLHITCLAGKLTLGRASHYFGLGDDLDAIVATFPKDPWMSQAIAYCRGLRLLRQEPWETLAIFLCSAVKQIPHIQQIDAALRSRFGEPTPAGHRFPTVDAIASAKEPDLRAIGLGFRAPNLKRAATQLLEGAVSLDAIATLPDDEALSQLQLLAGVGPKIANCVLLFGYARMRAVPVDTWIAKALRHLYYPRKKHFRPEFLRTEVRDRFGPYAGFAQQYLFHWLRKCGRSYLPPKTR